jgi:Flp pilus assembly protein TadD
MTRNAVEAEPDNYAYRDSYGWALFQLGHYEEAVRELRTACEMEEPDAIILDHLGDALERSGDFQGARSAWQQALQNLDSDDSSRQQMIQSKLEQLRLE